MAVIIPLILSAAGPGLMHAFRRHCCQPQKIQTDLLMKIVEKNRYTRFGNDFRLEQVHSFKDYQSVLPIFDYDALFPYIQNELEGKNRQLTVDPPIFFATTSGTTGSQKFIPVTHESRSAKSRLMRLWLYSLYRDHPGIFDGKIVTVVSPEVETHAPCGIPCGAESGHAYRNMPAAMKNLYSCPYEVFEIKDYTAKYYLLMRIAAEQSVSLIVTCNPSTILLLAQRLKEFSMEIIRDIHDGKINPRFSLSDPMIAILAPTLRPNPHRAKELEDVAKKNNGVLIPSAIWPRFSGIACWKGGTVGMYLKRFETFFPSHIPVRDLGYLSSENRGSVPIWDEGDGGVLAIDTNVFEFFPADVERKPEASELLNVEALETGKQYYIYATTQAGLYRYDMNDIVEVVDFFENTPVIRFIQKGKGVVSFTGEKLYESQVIAAITEVLTPLQNQYEFIAAVGEIVGERPRYSFLLELHDNFPDGILQACTDRLDGVLRRMNIEYASKRDSFRLDPPTLRIVKAGQFDAYRKRMVEKGRLDGQFKVLRLTNDPQFAREFQIEREYTISESGG